jgi:RNA polymerase sigma-70 factor (ECF subfamily)
MNPISATTLMSDELERLLLRISAKDEAAFRQLHAATRRKLFATVLVLVKRRHIAEEILQEAYVRIWLNAGAYRATLGTPMVWMITIARNLAIDTARKSSREVYADDAILTDFADDGPSALETIEMREQQHDAINHQRSIFAAVHALDPTKRHLVLAAYLYGESRDRLSKHYGVPVNTIKTWLRRALLEVRAGLHDGVASATAPSMGTEDSSVMIA